MEKLIFYLRQFELAILCFGQNSWQAMDNLAKYNKAKRDYNKQSIKKGVKYAS